MKLPEYSLKQELQFQPDGAQGDPMVFPAGTLMQVFWSEHNLPQHIKEQLDGTRKPLKGQPKLIMCIIGTFWIQVSEDNILKSGW
jgi:hypothetical protein